MFVKYYLIVLYNSDKLVCLSVFNNAPSKYQKGYLILSLPSTSLPQAGSGWWNIDNMRDAQETSYDVSSSWASSMSFLFPFQLFHITKFFIIRC